MTANSEGVGTVVRFSATWGPVEVRTLLAELRGAGLTPAHPSTGLASWLADDGRTDDSPAGPTPDRLAELAALADRDDLLFTLWSLDGTDVQCLVRRVHSSLYAVEFDLDGGDERRRQVAAAVLATVTDDPARTVGFVVDLPGRAREVDWDAVVQGSAGPITALPSLLGVPAGVAGTHPRLRTLARRDIRLDDHLAAIGDLDLLTRTVNPAVADQFIGIRRALEELRVTATSPDGSIRVTTGALGPVRDVRLDPGILRDPDVGAVARGVVLVAREAAARARDRAADLARPLTDRRPGEPVDPMFDPTLAELDRLSQIRPPAPRRDGRPVIPPMDLTKWRDRTVALRDRLRDATEAATSPDGLVTATVGGRGELVGLELDERVVDRDDVGWLADLIVKTAAAAFEQVDRS